MRLHPLCLVVLNILLFAGLYLGLTATVLGQQVIQRGPFGKPAQVLDETEQWTTPLLLFSEDNKDHDVEMYIPDVTSPAWLKRNYRSFEDKGQFELSMFTLYKTTKACEANQIAWGFADADHLNACVDIGYRVRQVTVDLVSKSVTLITAAMIDRDGQIVPASIQSQAIVRRWVDLDPNTQAALEKANALITKQMKLYDAKIQGAR
jgi:hypothetical protein